MDQTKPLVIAFEDDVKFAETYEEICESLGAEIVVTGVADNGLALIRELHPKLIILDVMLSGQMNGFDILEQIKRDETVKEIPVMMLTNLDSEEKVARSIGVTDYLVKVNLSLDELKQKIQSHLI